MRTALFLLIAAAALAAAAVHRRRLDEHVEHFEPFEINAHSFFDHSRGRRELHPGSVSLKISAFGRDMHLDLERNTGIFAHDAEFVMTDEHGEKTSLPAPRVGYYKGTVAGEDWSHCHLEMDPESGEVRGTVSTLDESYQIDPARRFFKEEQDFSHVIYRASDHTVMQGKDWASVCGEYNLHGLIGPNATSTHNRARRAAYNSANTACRIELVADFRFWDEFGQDTSLTISQMAEHFAFAQTAFGFLDGTNGFPEVVLQVSLVDIKTSDSIYQMPNPTNNDGETFLNKFSADDWSAQCLAHLFTYYDFANQLLGLAWLGYASGAAGGICQGPISGPKYTNTGFTTSNRNGRVPMLMNSIVTTHEFGHNFGSEHDAPASGSSAFIMNPQATDGSKANNKVFSTQSKNAIKAVVNAKGGCFEDASTSSCGNAFVDDTEECDCGTASSCADIDSCCEVFAPGATSTNCKLKGSSTCTPNKPGAGICCTSSCTAAPGTTECLAEDDCNNALFCDGAGSCPPENSNPKAANTLCTSDTLLCDGTGFCSVSLCTLYAGYEECTLTNGQNACLIGCRNGPTGTCQPIHEVDATETQSPNIATITTNMRLGNGANCEFTSGQPLSGICDNSGECIENDAEPTALEKLENFIRNFSLSDATEWAQSETYGVKNWIWVVLFVLLFLSILSACGCLECRSGKNGPRGPRLRSMRRRQNAVI